MTLHLEDHKGLLKRLQMEYNKGIPFTSRQLRDLGITRRLACKYCKAEKIRRITRGLYILPESENRKLEGFLALSNLLKSKPLKNNIHIGGYTALKLHCIDPEKREAFIHRAYSINLYGDKKDYLPRWARRYYSFKYSMSNLFRDDLEEDLKFKPLPDNFEDMPISNLECALLEFLYDIKEVNPYMSNFHSREINEIKKIFEGKIVLEEERLKILLNNCRRIKVIKQCLCICEKFPEKFNFDKASKEVVLQIAKEKGISLNSKRKERQKYLKQISIKIRRNATMKKFPKRIKIDGRWVKIF